MVLAPTVAGAATDKTPIRVSFPVFPIIPLKRHLKMEPSSDIYRQFDADIKRRSRRGNILCELKGMNGNMLMDE